VTAERRKVQLTYNQEHNITPRQIVKEIQDSLAMLKVAGEVEDQVVKESGKDLDVEEVIREMETEMMEAAKALEYERAALLRDQIAELRAAIPTEGGGTAAAKKGKHGKKKKFRY
jgi:excinuclease ABC subunit B